MDPRAAPGNDVRPMKGISVLEPLEHSVLDVALDGRPMEGISVLLTGWANDMEVEFMIDTGCQVTILATTVFERMCTADPMVRSRLRPCICRLVSADSSPLTVKGELELNVVFLGVEL